MLLTRPEMHGMDSARLARIAPFLEERYITPGKLAHADVLVARHGEPVYRATLGAARADGTALKDDAIYRIASMTKPVTSIAFMMLLEEGKVALDDPVSKVLPEFANLGVYAGGGGAAPDVATITTPADGATISGSSVAVTGTGHDPEDGHTVTVELRARSEEHTSELQSH